MDCCTSSVPYRVQGKVMNGFEGVRQNFVDLFKSGIEINAQLCVYVGEYRVIDIYGTTPSRSQQHYTPDSLQCIFSSGKTVAAILIAIMVQQGRLVYEEKVATYWPEFRQNGKDHITVQDVLGHKAGMWFLHETVDLEQTLTENVHKNQVGSIIETDRSNPLPGGANTTYHAITKDWITNEIFRRVEPKGRTMGEYFRQEIMQQGAMDIYINMTDQELNRVVDVKMMGLWKQMRTMMKSNKEGRVATLSTGMVRRNWTELKNKKNELAQVAALDKQRAKKDEQVKVGKNKNIFKLFNNVFWRKGETPSGSIHASARGLAKLAGVMANRGQLGDYRLLNEEVWEEFHSGAKAESTAPFGTRVAFTKGGAHLYGSATTQVEVNPELEVREVTQEIDHRMNHRREGWVGWMGLGGSIFQWHPELKIGFSYCGTHLFMADLPNQRIALLQHTVVQAVLRQQHTPTGLPTV